MSGRAAGPSGPLTKTSAWLVSLAELHRTADVNILPVSLSGYSGLGSRPVRLTVDQDVMDVQWFSEP